VCVAPALQLRVPCVVQLLLPSVLVQLLVQLLVQPCVQPFLERAALSPPIVRGDVYFYFFLFHGLSQLSRWPPKVSCRLNFVYVNILLSLSQRYAGEPGRP
jgi:hypothetical protein